MTFELHSQVDLADSAYSPGLFGPGPLALVGNLEILAAPWDPIPGLMFDS